MILESPAQFEKGFTLALDTKVAGTYTGLAISGMGGSALPVDILRILLTDVSRRHGGVVPALYQNRSYGIPVGIPDKTLHILCSYSGNTEETLESFDQAQAKGLPCIALSAGGELERRAKEVGVPHVLLPIPSEGFQPRMGTGFFIGVLIQILINQGMILDVREEILRDAEAVVGELPTIEEAGKALSAKLVGKTPIIYAPESLRGLAMVWKIKLNENAKTPAFYNAFPELNHNEMVGFTLPQAKFVVVMLRDRDDHPRNQKRFELTAELLRKQGVEVEILDTEGISLYNRVLMSIALGDFTSYYLALAYGQDPTPVDMVEQFKKLLV
jgi:glucose/mannose-6-phosphate isomerase